MCLLGSTACTGATPPSAEAQTEPAVTRSPSTTVNMSSSIVSPTTVIASKSLPSSSPSTGAAGPTYAALPPCAPPPFRSLDTGDQRVNLLVEAGQHASVNRSIQLRTDQTALIDLGSSCDSAADFTTTGSVKIVDHLSAPLPNSGWNQALIRSTAASTGTVFITGRRTCSRQGVTNGICFGDPMWHIKITVSGLKP
jgi:hypothetical protein